MLGYDKIITRATVTRKTFLGEDTKALDAKQTSIINEMTTLVPILKKD
jgi:hypothetical protein